MDTIKLRAFCTVASLRSISKAAEKLYYTQPAISTQIRALETEYGVHLFSRTGNRVELTEAGRELLPIAKKLLDLFEESSQTVRRIGAAEQHYVRIGASPLPGVHFVPGLIATFTERHPEHSASLTIANSYQLERMMLENEVDLCIMGRSGPLEQPSRFVEVALLEDPLVLVIGNSHRLAGCSELDPSDLAGEKLILPPSRMLTRIAVEERLRQLGVEYQLSLEIANSEAIKRLVAHGLGSSIMCASVIKDESAVGWLQGISIRGLNLSRQIHMAYRHDREPNPAASDLIKLTATHFKQAQLFPIK